MNYLVGRQMGRKFGRKIWASLAIVLGLTIVVSGVVVSRNAFAASALENKMKKASLLSCIRHGGVVADKVKVTDDVNTVKFEKKIFDSNAKSTVPLYGSEETNCYALLTKDEFGFGSKKILSQLELFGFSSGEPEGVSTEQLVFTDSNGLAVYSNKINFDSNNGQLLVTLEKTKSENQIIEIKQDGDRYKIVFKKGATLKFDGGGHRDVALTDVDQWDYLTVQGVTFDGGSTKEEFMKNLYSAVRNNLMQSSSSITYNYKDDTKWTFTLQEQAVESSTSKEWTHTKSDDEVARNVASDIGVSGGVSFSDDEALGYYVERLKKYYFDGKSVSDYWFCDENASGDNLVQININSSGNQATSDKPCYIKTSAASNSGTTNGFSSPSQTTGGAVVGFNSLGGTGQYRQMDLNGVIEAINELVDMLEKVEKEPVILEPGEQPEVEESANLSACYNAGLKSTAWIICPAIDNMENTAGYLDLTIEEWLETPTSIYDNSGIRTAWSVVQGIANIAISVVLVVIIFSQLTGYGIDNYGIKKMLPKLILMAVLINLSFPICQIAVDLSNILGEGLRNIFGAIGGGVGAGDGTSFVSKVVAGVFAAAGAGGSAAGVLTSAALVGGPMAAIIILLALLGVLVAVLIFFIMLGARQVIIITCIVLAPIAFAAYILPNTQVFFKKWWNLFKAALVVFPICGAVGGISIMIRGLVSTTNGGQIWEQVVALLLPFAPFFLLPTLLKGALSALGTVGTAITNGLGALKSGAMKGVDAARGAVQDTQAYKDRTADVARRRQERNAQRTINRVNAREKAGRMSQLDKRRRFEAQQLLNRLANEEADINEGAVDTRDVAEFRAQSRREAQELRNYGDQYSTLTRGELADELGKAATDYSNDRGDANRIRLQAAILAAEGRGMNKEMLSSLGGIAMSSATDSKILGQLAGSKNKVLSQYGKQVGKQDPSDDVRVSIDNFAESNGAIKMSKAFADQGVNVLNGMDDDTLEYIKNHGAAVSTNSLLSAAAATTNEKELAQINETLQGKINGMLQGMDADANIDKVNLSGQLLAGMDQTTLDTLKNLASKDGGFRNKFVAASNDIAADPQLMSALKDNQRQVISSVRKMANPNDNLFDSASSLAEMKSQTQTPRVAGGGGFGSGLGSSNVGSGATAGQSTTGLGAGAGQVQQTYQSQTQTVQGAAANANMSGQVNVRNENPDVVEAVNMFKQSMENQSNNKQNIQVNMKSDANGAGVQQMPPEVKINIQPQTQQNNIERIVTPAQGPQNPQNPPTPQE